MLQMRRMFVGSPEDQCREAVFPGRNTVDPAILDSATPKICLSLAQSLRMEGMHVTASMPAVFFLTCGGTKSFPDPRMNSLEAAFVFAKTSNLQVLPL